MHSYSTDASERHWIYLWIALASLLVTYAIYRLLAGSSIEIPWWAESPSVLATFGVLYTVYDRWLWRQQLLWFKVSALPNLTGEWHGEVTSNFDAETPASAKLIIKQRWSAISIALRTEKSKSASTMACLNVSVGSLDEGLKYAYLNEPFFQATESMASHRGTAHLVLQDGGKTLTGEYYTGRGRTTHGRMTFTRSTRASQQHPSNTA